MQRDPTYLFAGGGSGGHLFPGIAVAQELTDLWPAARILFVGTDREVERSIVKQHGYVHRMVPAEPLASFRRNPIRFPWVFWKSCRVARMLLERECPRAVIGLGGYASAPTVIAASSMGIPTVLLEQNAVAGRATRWLSGRSSLVCLSFEETGGRFASRATLCVTGNPVRREIVQLAEAPGEVRETRTILVLGGSQGATAVNRIMVSAAEALVRESLPIRIVHQAGAADCQTVRDTYARLNVDAVVQPFFTDLVEQYKTAAIVVSRAGATTLAELACAGIPAILIPYPSSADDHQLHNANTYQTAGAAHLVEQTPDTEAAAAVARHIGTLLNDAASRSQMQQQMRALARPSAAVDVVDRLEQLIADRSESEEQPGFQTHQTAVVGDRQ